MKGKSGTKTATWPRPKPKITSAATLVRAGKDARVSGGKGR